MKQLFIELNKTRKETPKAFYGDLFFLLSVIGGFYLIVSIFS